MPAFSASPARSVEELPIDKFDEYAAGSLPPFPWVRLGSAQAGVDFGLRTDGESPFIGNLVTGKGLTMSVSNAGAGKGDGVGRRFTPAPEGPEFLAFDFRIGAADGSQSALDLHCDLVDAQGKGLHIAIGTAGGLNVAASKAERHVADIVAGGWYHFAANFEHGKTATITITMFPSKATTIVAADIEMPPSGLFDSLRFVNGGSSKQLGAWTIDNVMMAGQVDAPRRAWWPFDQAPIETLRTSPKKVFIYYYPIYPNGPYPDDPSVSWQNVIFKNPSRLPNWDKDRVDAGTELEYMPLPYPPVPAVPDKHEQLVGEMEHEVRMIRQLGVDGAFVDLGAFPGPGGGVVFNERAFAFMEAAAKIDPAFLIIPSIYGPEQPTDETAAAFAGSDVVRRALAQPNLYRLADGRIVISSWGPERYPASWWQKALTQVEQSGKKVAFVPQFNDARHMKDFSPFSYGMASWGPRQPGKFDWVKQVRPLTTIAIMPIVVEDQRTRNVSYWESCGSDLVRGLWATAIGDGADWAFINTWSDYSEQAQAPSTGIGYAHFDLEAYYTQWFKTGRQPEIKRDVLYYFYRNQHSTTVPAHGKVWKLFPPWVDPATLHAQDDIELLAFLKAPGELTIQAGDQTYSMKAPAGITSFKAPLPPGKSLTPVFSLIRDGKTIVSRAGQYPILDKIEYANMLYHSGVIAAAARE